MDPTRRLIALTAAAAALPLRLHAQAAWPSKPITLIIPAPPGGTADVFGRFVGNELAKVLGQPVVADNKAGASGTIATAAAARAQPDGHTLLLTGLTTHISGYMYAKVSYDPAKDFVPVAVLMQFPFVLLVPARLQVNTVQDLVALARSQPGKLNYGSIGHGSGAHLFTELFNRAAGVQATHVPYKGTAPMELALLNGELDYGFGNLVMARTHLPSGKLKALAVSGTARMAALPNVPTLKESGLPSSEDQVWQGIFAPAATPPEVVARLNREVVRILAGPEAQAMIAKAGAQPEQVITSPARISQFVAQSTDRWVRLARELNIKLD